LLKYGYQKYFVTTTKRLVAAAKFLVASTKILFVVPNFVAVTKPYFPCRVSFFWQKIQGFCDLNRLCMVI